MLTIPSQKARSFLRWLIPLVLIPLTVILGAVVFDEKRHLWISFAVALLAVILFLTGFERRAVGSRRMVLVSVMIAFCVIGRLIPFFKPVAALTVLTAVYLGGETGFMVGALSALLSNFYFGQGPWTAFQMLAWGLIGLLAGILSKPLQSRRLALLFYGVGSGVFYSLVMDVWTVISYHGHFHAGLYLGAVVTALPYTVLYALSNFIFLWFLGRPFGEKFGRIKRKYGI
ncbi:MAG: ECF transporter S component [Clostridia bacterium]|nr:ECF transporter S component [Clostridia bacterium]